MTVLSKESAEEYKKMVSSIVRVVDINGVAITHSVDSELHSPNEKDGTPRLSACHDLRLSCRSPFLHYQSGDRRRPFHGSSWPGRS